MSIQTNAPTPSSPVPGTPLARRFASLELELRRTKEALREVEEAAAQERLESSERLLKAVNDATHWRQQVLAQGRSAAADAEDGGWGGTGRWGGFLRKTSSFSKAPAGKGQPVEVRGSSTPAKSSSGSVSSKEEGIIRKKFSRMTVASLAENHEELKRLQQQVCCMSHPSVWFSSHKSFLYYVWSHDWLSYSLWKRQRPT